MKDTNSKLTETLLREAKNKGKKVVDDGVITPGHINLKDKAFKPKKAVDPKIITESDLEKEKLKEISEAKRFTKEFWRQYRRWVKKKDWGEYDNVVFDHDDYLVRLFEMDITSFEGYTTLKYEFSHLQNNYKIANDVMKRKVFPIAKILKVGRKTIGEGYVVGDCVIVPSNDILGDDWNPKFLHIMQFQKSSGMEPVVPDGMEQRVPNSEIHWDRYKFIRPWVIKEEHIDSLTYLIPSAKVRGLFID